MPAVVDPAIVQATYDRLKNNLQTQLSLQASNPDDAHIAATVARLQAGIAAIENHMAVTGT
jgi:hypothetical protein